MNITITLRDNDPVGSIPDAFVKSIAIIPMKSTLKTLST
jgi:hypothetical protein